MIRSTTRPQSPTLRVAMLEGESAGMDEDDLLLNVVRFRGGVWVPVTPTLAEIDLILDAMEGADPGVWYWIEQ